MFYNKSFLPKECFALMVSGGNDSIVAAHFLASKQFDFIVLHVNQQFIEQDDVAADNVRAFCEDFGLEYEILNGKEEYKGGSKEDFCRKARFSAIRNWASLNLIDYIATAQHLNDCCESYLLNVLRGKAAYCPIPPMCDYPECTIFRPFLLTTRGEMEKYAKKHKLKDYIMEDELNKDTSLMRNWTRKELIPKIETRYTGLEKVVRKIVKNFVDRDLKFDKVSSLIL